MYESTHIKGEDARWHVLGQPFSMIINIIYFSPKKSFFSTNQLYDGCQGGVWSSFDTLHFSFLMKGMGPLLRLACNFTSLWLSSAPELYPFWYKHSWTSLVSSKTYCTFFRKQIYFLPATMLYKLKIFFPENLFLLLYNYFRSTYFNVAYIKT